MFAFIGILSIVLLSIFVYVYGGNLTGGNILGNHDDDDADDDDDNDGETRPELLQVAKPADLVSPRHQLHKPLMRYLDEIFGFLHEIFEY